MTHLFRLNIYSQEKTLYDGEIFSLIAPGESGYLGVLANHAPLIANLVPGKITIKDNQGKENTIQLQSPGFLEVSKNMAKVLLI
ncbi:MAG TPA: hypothetical protein PLH56_04400 [Candidatus Omnitrophota bacterium]|nr:hypothetical protein [Candidatus Omnitrophota bacterium]HPN88560.1 hypothetical protein [Candidatus Omnitrophota bacterium]